MDLPHFSLPQDFEEFFEIINALKNEEQYHLESFISLSQKLYEGVEELYANVRATVKERTTTFKAERVWLMEPKNRTDLKEVEFALGSTLDKASAEFLQKILS